MIFGNSGNGTPAVMKKSGVGIVVLLVRRFEVSSVQFAIKVVLTHLIDGIEPSVNLVNKSSFQKFSQTVSSVVPSDVDSLLISISGKRSRGQIPVFTKSLQDAIVGWAHPFRWSTRHTPILTSCTHRYTDCNIETRQTPLLFP